MASSRPHALPVDGRAHRAVRAATQAVGDRQDRHDGLVAVEGDQNPVDRRRVEQRAGRVMDQHLCAGRWLQGFQAGLNRSCACLTARDGDPSVQPGQCFCRQVFSAGRDDHLEFGRSGG